MISFTHGSTFAHASINSALPSVDPSLTKSNSRVEGRSASFSSRSRSNGKTFASFKKGMTMLSSGRFMVLCCESSDQITLGTRYGLYLPRWSPACAQVKKTSLHTLSMPCFVCALNGKGYFGPYFARTTMLYHASCSSMLLRQRIVRACSIPTTCAPSFAKRFTVSEPINPADPVTIILRTYSTIITKTILPRNPAHIVL